ncbi:MAG: M3 family metallopeptidase [Sulfurovum sp.]|nr:M3 family metallopeptidase [Sulfurovum sp.]MCB4750929.1 M3 family metallopeptidase [Sulfurovum sp.]MCB4773853.1 M3 family metallopeptidase [Sulfurovum sp.]MCB4775551.1 M3 family metallopeptidase [Sulfurovum sp.]MCB4777672.1 M3 family metallopeptidase [Sulfurovum sp.]
MFQTFQIENLNYFPKSLEVLLQQQRKKIKAITQDSDIDYEKVLKPLQDLDEELNLFFSPLSHLNAVMNSKETQKAYEASLPILSKFDSEMAQNVPLFKKIEKLNSGNSEQQKVIENNIRDFRLSGINLPKAEKKRLEEINLELSKLSNAFSQNLLDATNAYELIIEDKKDVAGMPQTDIDASKTEIEGKTVYKFTLQIPSYLAYMTYGSNRAYREKLYKAYSTRAPQNAEVIDHILSLRQEKAKILGFENYALYALQTRDASSEEEVLGFLDHLTSSALPQAREEFKSLKEFAKKIDNINSLSSYDVAYYSEKLKKERFDYDDAMTKPYFEQQRVLDGLLTIISELFGVTFKYTNVPTWHNCVKTYDIFENEKLSGRIYFDLEARQEKSGGAWMNDWETHFVDTKNKTHLASAFVVCNYTPATKDTPSLLRHNDVVTLFHEMGHAIHHLFGKCKERSISGINGVAWDVVEFPSQFLENFAYEPTIIKRLGFHYKTGAPIPNDLVSKIKETKNFQAALSILRQVEFSLFDFKLHQALYQGDEIQVLLNNIREKTTLLKPPSYNKFQHSFSHIFAGGYAAGYYAYKWAEVLSADAFFACLGKTKGFDEEKAKGYKRYILNSGGIKEMGELYTEWLGRKPQIESLIKLYEMT